MTSRRGELQPAASERPDGSRGASLSDRARSRGSGHRRGTARSTASHDARDGLALRNLIEAMRYEVALELGGPGAAEGQFGDWTTAQSGRFGAILYKRAKALLAAQGQSSVAAKYETSEASVPENGRDQTEDSAPKNRRTPKNRHKGKPHAKQRGQ